MIPYFIYVYNCNQFLKAKIRGFSQKIKNAQHYLITSLQQVVEANGETSQDAMAKRTSSLRKSYRL